MKDDELIRHPKVYEIVTGSYMDDDKNLKEICKRVTIPFFTMEKLSSDKKYAFYEFMDGDGLSVILPYDAIVEIRRVIV